MSDDLCDKRLPVRMKGEEYSTSNVVLYGSETVAPMKRQHAELDLARI